jgi:hypothetical protein
MPGPLQSYRDSNGVTWTVMQASNGWTLLGSVLDEADPKYDPPPEDVTASMPPAAGEDLASVIAPTPEQTRVIFIELRNKMEQQATKLKGKAVLGVSAKAPIPWWVWALLGFAVLKARRR